MIDLHSHVLPGIDDGARSMAESLEILRTMEADGVRIVAATPHVHERWPTRPETMELALAEVRAAAAAAGLSIDVRGGGEIALDRLELLDDEARSRFGLAGNPALLLVEFPLWGWPLSLASECELLRERGVVPLVAHPERSPEVQADPMRLAPIVEAGAYVQLTAISVEGRLGRAPARCSRELLRLGLAHVISSDAHAPAVRAAGLGAAAAALDDDRLGAWLTTEAPRALVEGLEPPARPARPESGRRWWRTLAP